MPKSHPALPRALFERLVRDHHAAVYASSLRLVRDPALAADVVQQVYVALLEGRFVVPASPRATDEVERALRWYAVRTSLSELRANANRRRREEDYAMRHDESGSHAAGAHDARPLDEVEARDEALHLQRAIERLPDELRVPLRLRFDEGCTYASIGDALAISEPSAHERVRRALERLRDVFTRSGRGALALAIEQRMIDTSIGSASTGVLSPSVASTSSAAAARPPVGWPHASASEPAVPAHLAPRLLALHAGSMAIVSSVPLALASLLALAATAVLWIGLASPSRGTDVATSATADGDGSIVANAAVGVADVHSFGSAPRAGERVPVDPASPESNSTTSVAGSTGVVAGNEETERRGTIRGLVVDASGTPAEGREVNASSVERAGKFSRWSAAARTRIDGTFALEVPIGANGATNYRVGLADGARLAPSTPSSGSSSSDAAADVETSVPVRAVADVVVDAGVLKLAPVARDEPGAFTWDVKIVDAQGRPVPSAVVVLSRRVRTKGSFGATTWEAGGRVDASGLVTLRGTHVGDKRVVVDARDAGYRKVVRDLVIESGAWRETIVLEQALEIRGRLVDADGAPVRRASGESRFGDVLRVYTLLGADGEWHLGDLEDDGSFVLRGLDPGRYPLRIAGGPWSSIRRDDVPAGSTDVVLRLKHVEDLRAVGDHAAEIHPTLVDAVTRRPVAAPFDVAEVVAIPADTTDVLFREDVVPLNLWERPVQREFSGVAPPTSDRLHVTNLDAGTYALAVRVDGYAPAIVGPIRLAAHDVRSDVVVELRRPVALSGRVVDAEGRPITNAWVAVVGRGPATDEAIAEIDADVVETDGRPRTWNHDLVETGADGRFVLRGLPPGLDVRVAALHRLRRPAVSDVVTTGAVTDVTVTSSRAR